MSSEELTQSRFADFTRGDEVEILLCSSSGREEKKKAGNFFNPFNYNGLKWRLAPKITTKEKLQQ